MLPYELFEVLARTTWRTIDRAHRNRILFGEDAITSVNLNTLASAGPKCVVVEDTRVDEAQKGCDFEFWIGSDFIGWSRYAIQAKKLSIGRGTYTKLNHEVSGRQQIDILDQYARLNRAAALYCMYNFAPEAISQNCPLPCDVAQLGCTVTPSATVRMALMRRGCRNFSWLHSRSETLPWRCLVRCPKLIGYRVEEGPPGWPPRSNYYYERLPTALQRLREERRFEALAESGDLYNRDMPLRPGWVGIIDASDSEG